ncbi:MAG: thioesterase family protein [SAR324 cluster bacterium]|nr:thioesterase family protein [SAR324 cluster bacterium]
MNLNNIPVGATGTLSVEVSRELTVAHILPHLPEVYSTPNMIALMESAAQVAIDEYLADGWVAVGTSVNIKHLAATPIGFTVTATAKVVEVSDRTVSFEIEAHDGIEKVGAGTHVRAPVELSRFKKGFLAKLAKN